MDNRPLKRFAYLGAQTPDGWSSLPLAGGNRLSYWERDCLSKAISIRLEYRTLYPCGICGEYVCNEDEDICLHCETETN